MLSEELEHALVVFSAQPPEQQVEGAFGGQEIDQLERLDAYSALEVVGLVTPLLEAPSPAVRARAAVALWRFGSLSGLPALEALLAEPGNPACHSAGLEALGCLGRSLESGALERLPGLMRRLSQEKAAPGRAELDDDTSGLSSIPKISVEPPRAQPASEPASQAQEVSRGPSRSETTAGIAPADDVRIERLLRLGLCDAAAAHQAIRTMDPALRRTAEGTYLRLREMLATESEEALPLAEEYVALPSGPLVAPYLELGLVFASRWDEARTLRCYLNAFKTQVAVLSSLLDQVQDHLGRDEFSQAQASLELLTKLMPLDESVHRSAGRRSTRRPTAGARGECETSWSGVAARKASRRGCSRTTPVTTGTGWTSTSTACCRRSRASYPEQAPAAASPSSEAPPPIGECSAARLCRLASRATLRQALRFELPGLQTSRGESDCSFRSRGQTTNPQGFWCLLRILFESSWRKQTGQNPRELRVHPGLVTVVASRDAVVHFVMMRDVVRVFSSFREAEEAERTFYTSLSPQERLDVLLELVARHSESMGEDAKRLERVYRVVELSRR